MANQIYVFAGKRGETVTVTQTGDSYFTTTEGLNDSQFWFYKQAMAYLRRGDEEDFFNAATLLKKAGLNLLPVKESRSA